jgi:hypothetical protein
MGVEQRCVLFRLVLGYTDYEVVSIRKGGTHSITYAD